MESNRFGLYPVTGGEPLLIPGISATDWPLRFNSDGTALFVSEAGAPFTAGLRIVRLDLATGRREPILEITPPDSKGLRWQDVDITSNGGSYLYSYFRFLSELDIIDGLR